MYVTADMPLDSAAMSASTIPARLNCVLVTGIVALVLLQMFVLPLWVLPVHPGWGWIVLPLALLTPAMWGLIHEAIHGMMHPDKEHNERLGRMLGIFWGASFHTLVYGHLMHHRLNRHWESEHYHPARTSWLKSAVGYYYTLLSGLYVTEVLVALAFAFAPRTLGQDIIHAKAQDEAQRIAAERYFFKPARQCCIRHDMLAVLGLYGASLVAYGAHWPLWLAMVLGRALVASLFDNIYHYGTPDDNSVAAKEVSAPWGISLLLLHMNYHNTHHRNAAIPWLHLPHHFAAKQGIYTESLLVSFGRQCLGPRPLI